MFDAEEVARWSVENKINYLIGLTTGIKVAVDGLIDIVQHPGPVEIRALQDRLKKSADALAASVAANQPTQTKRGESMDPLQGLADQVAQNTTVEGSAKVLIDGFAARLAAAGTDPVKLKALQDSLKSSSDSLAASVAANTPATTGPQVSGRKK